VKMDVVKMVVDVVVLHASRRRRTEDVLS